MAHSPEHQLSRAVKDQMRRNDADNWAWYYGLPKATQYPDMHPDFARSYTRALNHSHAAMLRWIDKARDNWTEQTTTPPRNEE